MVNNFMDFLRNSWFLIMFIGTIVWWAAHQDSSMLEIQKNEARITTIENRINVLENGIARLQVKIDSLKDDIVIIKQAVMK